MSQEIIKINQFDIENIQFRNNKLSENSKQRYTTIVKNYYKYIQKQNLVVGPDSIREWLNQIDNPSTHKLSLSAIREYLLQIYSNESPERRLELREFFDTIKRKKPKESVSKFDFLTHEQINELVSVLTVNLALITESLFWTGCRVTELINIKKSDCKVNDMVVIRIRNGKGNKEREVYLPLKLYEEILATYQGQKYIFETSSGKQFTREYISHELKRQTKEKLKIEISAHTLRHSKAMYLKNERNLTPDQIAKALGHSTVVTTLKYYFHGNPSAEDQGIY